MKKLLLTGAFNYNKEQLDKLEKLGFEIIFLLNELTPLDIDVSGINAIVCNNLFLYNDIEKFKNLEFIQLTSAGQDRVPIDYINKKGIKLLNARGVYSTPMAEWVILKILEIYKNSKFFYKNQEQHIWKKYRDILELTNKTASIIGFGSVGNEIAKMLKAFDVRIISVDVKKIEKSYVDESFMIHNIEEALKKSDIIILTLPLTKKTKHLINRHRIKTMKDKAVLINIARGQIINETDLIEAIESGKFLGVALDVFEEEPLKESPLWNYQNVIITPHNSFVSDKNKERLFEKIICNVTKYIQDI